MGTTASKIIKIDTTELIEMLNKALADEWLAYYQYWIGSKIVRGSMRPNVEQELSKHPKEEFEHANMLAERIILLGEKLILNPEEWKKMSSCGYYEPKNEHVKEILKQNIR